jgi:PST family polysaccharide transporter
MGTDYFPRLTGIIHDKREAASLVNDQIEVALLIAGPILLGMFVVAPQAIRLLYAGEFEAAAPLFRWQLLGSLFKVAIYPAGFVLVAGGANKTFLASELSWNAMYVGLTALTISRLGLEAVGVAFAVSCVAGLVWVYWIARRMIGFVPRPRLVGIFLLNLALLCSVHLLLTVHESGAIAWGAVATGISGLVSFRILIEETVPGEAARLIGRVRDGVRGWRMGKGQ